MPYSDSYLFPDPLLSDKFFYFEDYLNLSEEGKISGEDLLGFLEEKVESYITEQINQEYQGDIDEQTRQNAIEFFIDRFFSELGIKTDIDMSRNRLATAYHENLLPTTQKEFIDNKYSRCKTNIINGITTASLIDWMCEQLPDESIHSMTDRLVKEGWIDLSLNQERLKNPQSYFYKRNGVNSASSVLLLVNENYAIYPSNLFLSWIKIENKKLFIDSLINQSQGLAQLQAILPTDQKNVLVNYLIQTKDELNVFFEELNPLRKRQGFNWLQKAQLDLNLKDSDASENKALLDFLDDENRVLLQKIEIASALATYADPYFTDKLLTFPDYQALTDEGAEKEINQKIKAMYGYAEDQLPIYPDRMGKNDAALTEYLKTGLEDGSLQKYKDEYSQTLDKIGHWLDRNGIKSSQNVLGSTILQRFKRRIFDKTYELYFLNNHENTPYIYIEAKKALEDIVVLLEDESISLKQRKHQMQTMLADDTFEVCTAGCGSKIAAINESLRTQFYKPNTETLIKRFIDSQIREIIRQSTPQHGIPLETFVSFLWNEDTAMAGGMDVHAENYVRKQLAIYLGMEFIMPTKDIWVENAEKALVNKPEAVQQKIQLLTEYVIKKLKTKLTLENLIEYIWNSKTDLEYDELYNELELLADVINPDKTKYQLSDNYLRHYLYNLDLDDLKKQYLASLGDEQAILQHYFPQENSETIKNKYPDGCKSLISYIIDYYAGSPEVYNNVEDAAKPFYQKHLVDTAKLLFTRAYVKKLDQEAWISFDLDKPRLQGPVSYFKQRNPDLKQISAFNARSDQYQIFYSNLGLSWAHIQDKDQFILDIFVSEKGLNTLSDLFPKGQIKEAVNALFQTPNELNRLFDKLPESQYLQALSWLSDLELNLSAHRNTYKHTLFLAVLYQIEPLKRFNEVGSYLVAPYLSEKFQIALMKQALSIYPDLNQKLKLYLQYEIDLLGLVSFESTIEPTFTKKLEAWTASILALGDQLPVKNKLDAEIKFADQFKKIYRSLHHFSERYQIFRQALQEKLRDNSDKNGLEEKIHDLTKFIEDSRKTLEREIKSFDRIAEQLIHTSEYNVANKILVNSVVEQGLSLLDMSNRYAPLVDEINFLVKEKVLTDFSDMMFIPPFTDLSPIKRFDSLFYEKIDFSYCSLDNAFFMADIFKTKFHHANLKKVIFAHFSRHKADTWLGQFAGASFSTDSFLKLLMIFKENSPESVRPEPKAYNLKKIDLRAVDFQDKALHNALQNFPRGYVINLSEANAQGADFSNYDLSRMLITRVNMAEVKFKDVSFGPLNDLSNVQLESAVFENVKLANFKQFFALYDHGIRDFSNFQINSRASLPDDFRTHTLVDAILPNDIFYHFYAAGRKDFKGVNLEKIEIKNFESAKHLELEYDPHTKFPVGYTVRKLILTTYQELFDLYDQGIRDFSAYSLSAELKMKAFRNPLPAHLLDKSIKDMILSDRFFADLYLIGRRDFRGTDLREVSPSLIEEFKDESKNTPNKLLFDRSTQLPPPWLESKVNRQKAYLVLNKKLQKNKLSLELKAVNQGLYFPSFEKRGLTIQGKCVSITRGFLQSLFLGKEDVFLSNLNVATNLYERIASNQKLSVREESTLFAFQHSLDSFQEGREKTSSLPQSLIMDVKRIADIHPGRDAVDVLDIMMEEVDFSANVIVGDHVVAIYKRDGKYGYFDSNVAWISQIENLDALKTIMNAAIAAAGVYEMSDEGFRVEAFNVFKANQELGEVLKESLTTALITERDLFALQDSQQGPLHVNGKNIYRKTLYDMGAKIQLSEQDPIPQLIHNEMTTTQLVQAIETGRVSLSAVDYLEKLKGKTAVDIKEIGVAVSTLSFSGTKREVEAAEKVKSFLFSQESSFLNNYEWKQILDTSLKGSFESARFYSVIAQQRMASHTSNPSLLSRMGLNAAGQISLFRGLHSTLHAGVTGDSESFFLGAGEISFSFLSDAIEKGVLRLTPKLIKQLKSGIYLSKGFAGLLANPFDIVDLVQSSLALSKAEKDSKAYRDAIAGITFSSASITSGVVLTAAGAAGTATVVGFAIVIGQMLYMGFSNVEEFKKYRLSTDQEIDLFFRSMVFLPPSQDVQDKAARHNHIKNIIERAREFLELLGDKVGIYVTGLGATPSIKTDLHGYYSYNYASGKAYISMDKHHVISQTYCGFHCTDIKVASLDESLEKGNYRQTCVLPLISHSSKYTICENAYVIGNITRMFTSKERSENTRAIYDLRWIDEGTIINDADLDSEYQIYKNSKYLTIYGSSGKNRTNWFKVLDGSFSGLIEGGNDARNILDLSQLDVSSVFYDQKSSDIQITNKQQQQNTFNWRPPLHAMNSLLGSHHVKEVITCDASTSQVLLVDTRGNVKQGIENADVISDCRTVFVYGQTQVKGSEKLHVFYIKPTLGQAEIDARGGELIFSDPKNSLYTALLSYSSNENTLTFSFPTCSFVLTLANYLDLVTKEPQFKIIDHEQTEIRPILSEQIGEQRLNLFYRMAFITPEHSAQTDWIAQQQASAQAQAEIERQGMLVFSAREEVRRVYHAIKKTEAEISHEEPKKIWTVMGHGAEINLQVRRKRDITSELAYIGQQISQLKKKLSDLTTYQPLAKKKLNEAYGKLDKAKTHLKEVQQAKKEAQMQYETRQKLTANKREIERIFVEVMQKQNNEQIQWFRSEKKSLLELINSIRKLEPSSSLDVLTSFINKNQIKEAYLFYFSEMSNTLSLSDRYAEMMSNPINAYGMVGTDKKKKNFNVLLGSSGTDSFPITSEIAYVQGGNGADLYQFVNGTGYNFITINNKATDNEIDILNLSAISGGMSSAYQYRCGLLVSLSTGDVIYIKDYFLNADHKHLTFIDDHQRRMWIADPSIPNCHSRFNPRYQSTLENLSMIPFYTATTHYPLYWISKEAWSGMSSLVAHTEFDQLVALYEKNDLILKGENTKNQSLIIRLHDFYPIPTDKKILYTYPDFSFINLNELARLALPAKEIEEQLAQEFVQIHTVSANQSVVMPFPLNPAKTHVLAFEQAKPNDIVVDRTDTDLVLHQANQSIIFKDWDAENVTRADSLWFDELSRGLDMKIYHLNQTTALQAELRQLDLVGAIDNKIKTFDSSVVNALIYFLAINSHTNAIQAAAALGFESSGKMEDFILGYEASLSKEMFTQWVCTDRFLQIATQVLPWILTRGLIKEPDESIQRSVFAYLMDTHYNNIESYAIRDNRGKLVGFSTPETFFAQLKFLLGSYEGYSSSLEDLEILINKLLPSITQEELSKHLTYQLPKVLSFKMHSSTLEHESVQAAIFQKEEQSSTRSSWTMPVVWGAVAGVATSLAASLGYFMLGYLRRDRQQPTGVAAAAAVTIPLMQFQSQVEAVVTKAKGVSAPLKQDIPVMPCSRESFFKPIPADKQVPRLEASAANHSTGISFQYAADHYENTSFFKLLLYSYGKDSVVKRMNKAERMSTYCERDDQHNLPEDLYWAKRYLEEGIASFGKK